MLTQRLASTRSQERISSADLIPFCQCVAPATRPPHTGKQLCGGTLIAQNPDTWRCAQCGMEYPVTGDVPRVLPRQRPTDHYDDSAIIRTYYEAHYGPFIKVAPHPPQALTRKQRSAPRRAYRDMLAQAGEPSLGAALRYQRLEQVTQSGQLTEDFYQCMRAICAPYITPQTRALDVGCGLGRMTAELARLGAPLVVGLDRSPQMADTAAQILRATGPLPIALNDVGAQTIPATLALPDWDTDACAFMVGDVMGLPLQAETFDVVTCFNVFDRVPNPRRMVAELRRVVRPGGHLILTDPYHWEAQYTPPRRWVGNMADLFAARRWDKVDEIDDIPFVLRYYSRRVTAYANHCLVYRKRVA